MCTFINNRYNIIKKLGEGGMGSVYLAEDKANSNRLTALKTIKGAVFNKLDKHSLQQLKHEYDVMHRLWHPNLAKVYEFGEMETRGHYMAMEYIDGCELKKLIKKGKINFSKGINIITELLRAVEFIHSRDIVYCDVKPQNILVTKDNRVKLIDFGLSDFKSRLTTEIKGTIAYIAPETINRKKKDFRTDIFSLGVLFYEILTRKPFHSNSSIGDIVSMYLSSEQYRQHEFVYDDIENEKIRPIIKKMCSFDPEERYSSCVKVLMDISAALNKPVQLETDETKEAYVIGVPFTSRKKELEYLISFLKKEENKLLLITGKQGEGKSRLIAEFQKLCTLKGVVFFQGNIIKNQSYEPFLQIFSDILYFYSNKINPQKKSYLKILLPNHPALCDLVDCSAEMRDAETLKNLIVEALSGLLIDIVSSIKKKTILFFNNLHDCDDISLEIINELLYKLSKHCSKNLKLIAECRIDKVKNIEAFLTLQKEKDRLSEIRIREFSENETIQYIKNCFGRFFLGPTLKKQIPHIYTYSRGNPFLLQELLKSMINEKFISRKNGYWELKGLISETKLAIDSSSILKKRIDSLKLSDKYIHALYLMSFTRQDKLYVDFFQKFVLQEKKVDWQYLFDLLHKNEFLVFNSGYYSSSSRLIREVLHKCLDYEKTVEFHRLWSRILEKTLPSDFNIKELEDDIVFDLAYHYYKSDIGNINEFLSKTAEFLFEAAIREKEKFGNRKSINYFYNLQKCLEKQDGKNKRIIQLKIRLHSNLGNVCELTGKLNEAERSYHEAIELSRSMEDSKSVAENQCKLAWLIKDMGRMDEALGLLKDARIIAESIKDDRVYSNVINTMGVIYRTRGNYAEAMKYYQEHLEISEKIGNKNSICTAIGNMANIYKDQCDYGKAMDFFQKLIKYFPDIEDRRIISTTMGNIGVIYHYQGNYDLALKYYHKQLKLCEELGDKNGISRAVGNIGVIYWHKGDYNKAERFYVKSLRVFEELRDKRGVSWAMSNIGNFHFLQGDVNKAIKYCDKAIEIARESNIRYYLCDYIHVKANYLYETGDRKGAKNVNREALQMALNINRKDIIFSAELLMHKIDNNYKALSNMLKKESPRKDLSALINYELWKMTKDDKYRAEALKLYKHLNQKLQVLEYGNKIEELKEI